MDHGVELAALQPARQVGRSNHVGELALLQVAPFAVMPSQSLTTTSARPASLRLATTFDPINPAPPVTNNIGLTSDGTSCALRPEAQPTYCAAALGGDARVRAGAGYNTWNTEINHFHQNNEYDFIS